MDPNDLFDVRLPEPDPADPKPPDPPKPDPAGAGNGLYAFAVLLIFAIGFALGFLAGRQSNKG